MPSKAITVDKGRVSCFGLIGWRDGGDWVINFGEGIQATVRQPTPATREVADLLANVQREGKAREVAYVGLSTEMAVCMFLDGGLTAADACNAADNLDGSVSIPEATVVVGGEPVTVDLRVIPDADYEMGTFRADGTLV